MRPITYEIPKPLIPVHGRSLTEHLIDLLKKNGITDIVLSVGHLKERIMDYFGDGSKFKVNISYIVEEEPLGTAGPLKLGQKQHKMFSEPFVLTNGDELKDFDLSGMIAFHKKHNAAATIALLRVEDPSAYGVARLDGDRITEFVEKPKKEEAPSNLINAGIYILDPAIIDMIPEGFSMIEKDIFPKLAAQRRLYGYEFKGQWFNTGNMQDYETAIKEWKDIKA